MNRKAFINRSLLTIGGLSLLPKTRTFSQSSNESPLSRPMIISTWGHGIPANEAAWEELAKGGRALDAVEKGVRVAELDPKITSVGYGGFPDRDGIVTLDACIMDETGNA